MQAARFLLLFISLLSPLMCSARGGRGGGGRGGGRGGGSRGGLFRWGRSIRQVLVSWWNCCYVTFCRENVVFVLWKKWKICVASQPCSLSSPVESQKVLFLGVLFRWGRSGGRGSSSGRPAPPPRPFGPTKPNLVSSVGETFNTFHHGHISAKLGWFGGQSSKHFTKQTLSRLH